MPVDEARVDHLLREWHAAHLRYQDAEARMVADGGLVRFKKAQPAAMRVAVTEAQSFREQAHDLDPQHTAPAWDEFDPEDDADHTHHQAVLAFYRQKLA